VPIRGERGACPSCGLAVRFVDVPGRPCATCGQEVPLPPGREAVACPACGAWQAADPARPLRAVAACPRCRREVEVPLDGEAASCPRCGQAMRLGRPRPREASAGSG
jgi:DNA-directed RNA polymerase subunit RPC12/RpoP